MTRLNGEPAFSAAISAENEGGVAQKNSVGIYRLFLEQLTSGKHRVSLPETMKLLSIIDVLVDGPFIETKKDIRLRFRGSSNQRVIDVQRSIAAGQVQQIELGDSYD